MRQFNLDEYLKNPNRKVVTRTGEDVRIICINKKNNDDFPIVALIHEAKRNVESIYTFALNGKTWVDVECDTDLFFAPVKHEGWINLYHCCGCSTDKRVYTTEQDAKDAGFFDETYITTIKIEWEE